MDNTVWIKKGYTIVGGDNRITLTKYIDTYTLTYNNYELMKANNKFNIDYCFRRIVEYLKEHCAFIDLDEE
jgi:hypothetical protein